VTPFDPEPWMDHGLCRDDPDPDLWFATDAQTASRAAAVAVCNLCPVKAECIDLAIRSRAEFGIWGGLDPTEIRKLKRRSSR